nr:HAD-IA family hydrolase [candidate division Zixibacteria bacterium]
MIHTVFFDVGGTLVTGESTLKVIADRLDPKQSEPIFRYMVDRFMEIYLDENPPRFYSIKELLTLSTRLAAEEFGTPDLSHQTVEIYRWHHMNNDHLYDDTVATLENLKDKGLRLILISDADADVLEEQLRMFDILKYFDGTIISSHTKAYKPSDPVVRKALEYCNEPLSGILFVGDTIVDLKTAEKMKVRSALINRNGRFKYKADHQITHLNQIFDIIDNTI